MSLDTNSQYLRIIFLEVGQKQVIICLEGSFGHTCKAWLRYFGYKSAIGVLEVTASAFLPACKSHILCCHFKSSYSLRLKF